MPRIRSISPRAPKDEDLADLAPLTRLAYHYLPMLADCAGRLKDRPRWIKAELFPYDDLDMESILVELAADRTTSKGPFLHRYEVGGVRYLEILRFDRYQNPHPNERKAYEKSLKEGLAIPKPNNDLKEDVTSSVSVASLQRSSRAGSLDHGLTGSLDPRCSSGPDEPALVATNGDAPKVHWDTARQAVELDEEWLRSELAELSAEANVVLTRPEFDYELEQLRLRCIADSRLRACIRKQDGKPSAPSQFKRMSSLAVSHFSQAIRNKARRMPARASPPITFGQAKDIDTASRIEKARERDQREEKALSPPTKQLPKQ